MRFWRRWRLWELNDEKGQSLFGGGLLFLRCVLAIGNKCMSGDFDGVKMPCGMVDVEVNCVEKNPGRKVFLPDFFIKTGI